MPDPDEITLLANQVYMYMARWPFPERPIEMEFVFKLLGLPLGSDKSRQVYDRLLLRLETEADYRGKVQGPPGDGNGQPAANSNSSST
jgi:hypothetical protein